MEDMNTYQNINRRRGCKGVARILLCAAFLISHAIGYSPLKHPGNDAWQ